MQNTLLPALTLFLLLTPQTGAQEAIAPRSGHRMIYIPDTDAVILFGGMALSTTGTYYNDLWLYTPQKTQWTKILTTDAPSQRGSPGFAYSPDTKTCLLLGGLTASGRLSDTWILETETMTWSKQSPANSPPARSDMGLVYDQKNKQYILYGGYGNTGGLLDDTWVYELETGNWRKINTETSPGKMYGQCMSWNPEDEAVTLYGGHIGSPVSSNYLDEVWTYDHPEQNWVKKETLNRPSGRYWGAADITESGQLVFHGGTTSSGPHGETLTLTEDTWTASSDQPTPETRFFTQLTYIGGDEFLLFGGGIGREEYSDTWIYSSSTGWTKLNPTYTTQSANTRDKTTTGIIAPTWTILIGIVLALIPISRTQRHWKSTQTYPINKLLL